MMDPESVPDTMKEYPEYLIFLLYYFPKELSEDITSYHIQWAEQVQAGGNISVVAFEKSGKTTLLTIGPILWAMFKKTPTRIAVVSNCNSVVDNIAGRIKKLCEDKVLLSDAHWMKIKDYEVSNGITRIATETTAIDLATLYYFANLDIGNYDRVYIDECFNCGQHSYDRAGVSVSNNRLITSYLIDNCPFTACTSLYLLSSLTAWLALLIDRGDMSGFSQLVPKHYKLEQAKKTVDRRSLEYLKTIEPIELAFGNLFNPNRKKNLDEGQDMKDKNYKYNNDYPVLENSFFMPYSNIGTIAKLRFKEPGSPEEQRKAKIKDQARKVNKVFDIKP